jgi:spermidine/putrescine transport system permease protein
MIMNSKTIRRKIAGIPWLTLWSIAVYSLLFAPVLVIVLFSFNAPRSRFNLIWEGITLNNWLHPFADPTLAQAFFTSLGLALLATFLCILLALPMTMALERFRIRGASGMEMLLVLPLTLPEVVLGASLLLLFVQLRIPPGPLALVISHTLFCLSYTAMALKARLGGHDWSLEEAAADLGASPIQIFAKITLPRLAPGLLSAGLLSLSISMDDYVVSSITAGSVVTFPLRIAGAFQREISPQIHVLSTMVLIISLIALVLSCRDSDSSERVRQS